jgi:hypothetical protein
MNAQSFNQSLIDGELKSALGMCQMARSHLVSARNISSPAFGVAPAVAQNIVAALGEIEGLIRRLTPQPQPPIDITPKP